jgi:hypothetical protein
VLTYQLILGKYTKNVQFEKDSFLFNR